MTRILLDQSIPVRIADKHVSQAFPHISTQCDVTDIESFQHLVSSKSVLINLAAEHRDDVRPLSLYHDVNVKGAEQVCAAARTAGASRIVFTSSAAVYGFQPRAIDENGPFEPFNEYGRTKLQAEQIYRAWAAEDPARTLVIVRPTVVFGEGNRGNVYNLMRQIASGRFFMVGTGENIKSIAYVGNVAAFLAHSLTLGPGVHIANYVDHPDMNTRELTTYIYGCLGKTGEIPKVPKSLAMAAGYLLDISARLTGRSFPLSAVRVQKFCETTQFKADRVAQWGFTPPYTLAEGLARTIAFDFNSEAAPNRPINAPNPNEVARD